MTGLGALRSQGADAIGAAIPAEGDLVGLGGPAAFNSAALDAGEAVLVLDAASFVVSGLVPERVGAAVTWRPMPAERRQLPDIGRGGPRAAHGAARGRRDAGPARGRDAGAPRWPTG